MNNILNNNRIIEGESLTGFTSNKIFLDSETIAEQLRSNRQAKGLKLQEVAKKLNINYKYLEALEKNELDKLPQGVYGKNFLREYAIFLGLDYKELFRVFESEQIIKSDQQNEELFSVQVAKTRYFLAMPKIIRNLVVASLVVVCFIYLGYRLEKIITPPELVINSPAENLITAEKSIDLSGTVEKEAQININGEPVLSDSSGNFLKKVDLKGGVNFITITAKKKYGRENVVRRQVLVRDNKS